MNDRKRELSRPFLKCKRFHDEGICYVMMWLLMEGSKYSPHFPKTTIGRFMNQKNIKRFMNGSIKIVSGLCLLHSSLSLSCHHGCSITDDDCEGIVAHPVSDRYHNNTICLRTTDIMTAKQTPCKSLPQHAAASHQQPNLLPVDLTVTHLQHQQLSSSTPFHRNSNQ